MPSFRPESFDRPSSVRRVLVRLLVANLAVVVAKLAVGIAAVVVFVYLNWVVPVPSVPHTTRSASSERRGKYSNSRAGGIPETSSHTRA